MVLGMVAQGKVIWMNFGTNSVVCIAYQFRKTRGRGRGFMGPVVQRPRLYWQILQLVSWARPTPDVLAPVSAIFSLVIPRVIRAYRLVLNDIKRLVLTAKNFHPKIFSGREHRSLLMMLPDSCFHCPHKKKEMSLACETRLFFLLSDFLASNKGVKI